VAFAVRDALLEHGGLAVAVEKEGVEVGSGWEVGVSGGRGGGVGVGLGD
jgi:hypothetical protein